MFNIYGRFSLFCRHPRGLTTKYAHLYFYPVHREHMSDRISHSHYVIDSELKSNLTLFPGNCKLIFFLRDVRQNSNNFMLGHFFSAKQQQKSQYTLRRETNAHVMKIRGPTEIEIARNKFIDDLSKWSLRFTAFANRFFYRCSSIGLPRVLHLPVLHYSGNSLCGVLALNFFGRINI